MNVFGQLFDVSLLATIGLIFGATLLGAYLRSSRRDICLKSFEHFHVTLERANGKIIWGVLDLESTGLELRYRDFVQDANHVESSYVLYANEYHDLQAIYRYVDDLSDEDVQRRAKDLNRSFHPGIFVRLVRSVQHFFSFASDSLTEVFGVVVGGLRKPAGRYITEAGEAELKKLGDTVIGRVGSAYDPLLERFVGQKVVVELVEGDEAHEHVGIFKNYSPDFMELLDVQFPQRQSLPLDADAKVQAKWFSATMENGVLSVKNHTDQPLLIQSLKMGEQEELLNVVVDGDEVVEMHPEGQPAQAELNVRVVRELDMIIPRTLCTVRHRAERYEAEVLPEIIFDLGVILRGSSIADAREARLRKSLAETPYAALAASNLGAILVQKQQFAEAEMWLKKAYAMRYSLPDNGRRTLMLLHELRRRQAKAPSQAARQAAFQATVQGVPDGDTVQSFDVPDAQQNVPAVSPVNIQ